MGKISKPELKPGPRRDLSESLHSLHQAAGRPSVRELARCIGAGIATHSRIHDVFAHPRMPSWGVLQLIVEQLASRIPGADSDAEERRFHRLWIAADGGSAEDLQNHAKVAIASREYFNEPVCQLFSNEGPSSFGTRIWPGLIIAPKYAADSNHCRIGNSPERAIDLIDEIPLGGPSFSSDEATLLIFRDAAPGAAGPISHYTPVNLAADPTALGTTLVCRYINSTLERNTMATTMASVTGRIGVFDELQFPGILPEHIGGSPVFDTSGETLVGVIYAQTGETLLAAPLHSLVRLREIIRDLKMD